MHKIKTLIRRELFGRVWLQPFFERLHAIALVGMNIGPGSGSAESGERNALLIVKKYLPETKNKPIIFDVGANIGDYANLITATFGESARVLCFEPSKETFAALMKNIGSQKHIETYNFGFGSTAERKTLFSDSTCSGLASVYKRDLSHFNVEFSKEEEIEIRTIDAFCKEKNISHIDLLKLDIEGNELNALIGAKEMLTGQRVSFVQFEFGGSNIDSRTFFHDFAVLFKEHYDLYRIVQDGIRKLPAYTEFQEVFGTTNYLAVNKNIAIS